VGFVENSYHFESPQLFVGASICSKSYVIIMRHRKHNRYNSRLCESFCWSWLLILVDSKPKGPSHFKISRIQTILPEQTDHILCNHLLDYLTAEKFVPSLKKCLIADSISFPAVGAITLEPSNSFFRVDLYWRGVGDLGNPVFPDLFVCLVQCEILRDNFLILTCQFPGSVSVVILL